MVHFTGGYFAMWFINRGKFCHVVHFTGMNVVHFTVGNFAMGFM